MKYKNIEYTSMNLIKPVCSVSVRTLGVVTLGLLPPMAPGRMEPVSL